MITVLAEQPLVVAMMLGLTAATLIFGWLQTGKNVAGVLGILAVCMIPVAFVIAATWETEREKVEAVLYEIADAVESNDHEKVYAYIADPRARAIARAELPRYEFQSVEVTGIRSIEVLEGTFPLRADADLNIKAELSTKDGNFRDIPILQRVLLQLEKQDDRWIIADYQHMPAVGGTGPHFPR